MNTCIPKLSTVTDIQKESVDTVSLTLRDFPSPDVGQFCMLHVFGVGEVPISVSGIGDRDTTFTIKAVGKVTEALTKLSDGDTVGIRGPFGSSWPLDSSKGKDVLVVAGGLGLAPLKPLLSKIAGNRKNFRKVILLYGTRSPSDLLFTPVLNQLEKNSDIDVLVTVDAAPAEWQGNVGAVTSLLNKVDFETGFLTAYLCLSLIHI